MNWDEILNVLSVIEKIATNTPGKFGNIVAAAHSTLQEIHDDLMPPESAPTEPPPAPAERSDGMPSPTPQGVSMVDRRV